MEILLRRNKWEGAAEKGGPEVGRPENGRPNFNILEV